MANHLGAHIGESWEVKIDNALVGRGTIVRECVDRDGVSAVYAVDMGSMGKHRVTARGKTDRGCFYGGYLTIYRTWPI